MVTVSVIVNKYGSSEDKDMLMKKLAIYEFGCRNILYLIFESLSIYYLNQKRVLQTICYSEIGKLKILLKKLKQRKKKRKKERIVGHCPLLLR